jgi:tight adherence protein B
MFTSELWLIYALVFGAVLLGVQAIYWLLFKSRHEQKTINRRLALSAEIANPAEVLQALRKERGIDFLEQAGSFQNLNEFVVQSGVRLTGPTLLGALFVLAGISYLFFVFAFGSNFLAIALASPFSVAVILLFLHLRRRRRIAAFSEQFPDALDVIVRGLRAGHPFRVALGLVAREMPDPVGTEFGIVADEIMFGLDQTAAVENLCSRVGQDDLAYFSTAISVQLQTGGNLAEILSRLSTLMRSRSKLRLKIRALSAEGRASAIALSLAPFVLFLIITLISRDYFLGIKDHPLVIPATILGALLLTAGNIAMYRKVNYKY